MFEHLPEEFLGHGGIARAVCMREGVTTRGCASDRCKLACVILEPVAAMLTGQLGDKTRWDLLANGVENGESASWLGSMRFLFH